GQAGVADVVVVGGETALARERIDVAGMWAADDLAVAVVFLEDPDHVGVACARPAGSSAGPRSRRPRRAAGSNAQRDRGDEKNATTQLALHRFSLPPRSRAVQTRRRRPGGRDLGRFTRRP